MGKVCRTVERDTWYLDSISFQSFPLKSVYIYTSLTIFEISLSIRICSPCVISTVSNSGAGCDAVSGAMVASGTVAHSGGIKAGLRGSGVGGGEGVGVGVG